MNVLMKFKAQITTEKTYPHSLWIEFCYEVTDSEDVFKGVYDYLSEQINKIVDATIECLGILQIRNIRTYEALDLARQGIQNLND